MSDGMHDSGTRQQFSTGAVRDTAAGKPRLGLISPFFLTRLGEWLSKGAIKYSPRNWELGMEFSRVVDSLLRHIVAYMSGDRSEDHLAAIAANDMFLIHYEEMIRRGGLPSELNDLPLYESEKANVAGSK